jgi:RNA polymerase sigma factor (sigma-70 family)
MEHTMESPAARKPSFTDMYAEFFPMIYSMIYQKINDHDSTHDLCQELFMRFHGKYDEIENHRRWLLSSVKYIMLEYLRKKKRKDNEIDIETMMNDAAMTFVNGMRDTRIMIEEALDTLVFFGEETNRTLFDMVALHQYTYKETAAYLGMTERQVRYKYRIVVNSLMRHFKEKGIHGMEDLL